MKQPIVARQFRVLYRDFLKRMIDLEILSARGEAQTLLVQFAAILGALSFVMAIYLVPRYATSSKPHLQLMRLAWLDEEFLIGTTMAIAGLFSVLAWNAVMPDRRDVLVLGPLPVRIAVIARSKIAALLTSLGVSVFAINAFTGLAHPFVVRSDCAWGLVRAAAAYWVTMAAAGLFICGALLMVQGIAAQVLSNRLFQRASSFLQLAAFFVILGAYFLKPPLATIAGLTAPSHQRLLAWIPTYWFLGLFQELNGPMHPVFGPLAVRALWALAIVLTSSAGLYVLAYRRVWRRIVEQPDIAPADRSRPSGEMVRRLAAVFLPRSVDRAILLFTARTIARSRQHRLVLAAYAGVAFAIGLAYLKGYLYGKQNPWDADASLIAPSVVMMVFAVLGARAVFALPIALPANWVFRITSVHSPRAYFSAARKSLAGAVVIPVWIACAAVYIALWHGAKPWQHLLTLGLLGTILVCASMARFRKIPFACSYLPGKANMNVRLAIYALPFFLLCDTGVRLEVAALHAPLGFVILTAILALLAFWMWRRAQKLSGGPRERLRFEELPTTDLMSLDLAESPAGESNSDWGIDFPRERTPLATVLEQLASDLRQAFRGLIKAPGFSTAAIALIALGIGGNTAIYSLIHGVLTRPAPGVRADGLVNFGFMAHGEPEEPEVSYFEYVNYAYESQTVKPLAVAGFSFFTMALPEASYELRGLRVTQNYFETLGVRIVQGRGFTAEEARGAAGLPAVIAYHVWQNQFHGENVIGRMVTLNGCAATIVGVAGQGFTGIHFAPHFEIGVPLEGYARLCRGLADLENPRMASLEMIGRLAPRASLRQAHAEFEGIGKILNREYPEALRGRVPSLAEYSATAFTPVQRTQGRLFGLALSGVGILTLLIVCANVANLMLARSVARQREMAVRRALGASHGRILRLLFLEGLALSMVAAGAAWIFAWWAARAVVKLVPPVVAGLHIEPDFTPDSAVALYAIALAALSALAFSAAPAIRAWRQQLLPWLKAGEHGVAQGRSLLANLLAGAQLALCVVLLTSAGLASRSLYLLGTADLHFDKNHLLLMHVSTSGVAQSQEQSAALLERLRRSLGALPGVTAASYASAVPPSNFGGWAGHARAQGGAQTVRVAGMNVGPGYLETLGVPVVMGRPISEADVSGDRQVAVINRHLADALWPNQSPLGRLLMLWGQLVEVIGVTLDGAFSTMQGANSNFVFLPERQHGAVPGRVLYLRYISNEPGMVAAARAAIHQIDGRIPVSDVRTMDEELKTVNAPQILIASLLGVFSTGSLIVAAIGLYAVVAFHTARRTRDFGIRLALGAGSSEILRTVLVEGLVVAAIGSALGLALSLVAGRVFGSLLVAVTPTDGLTYAGVIALVTAVSLAACAIPARRASRTDPVIALRYE